MNQEMLYAASPFYDPAVVVDGSEVVELVVRIHQYPDYLSQPFPGPVELLRLETLVHLMLGPVRVCVEI